MPQKPSRSTSAVAPRPRARAAPTRTVRRPRTSEITPVGSSQTSSANAKNDCRRKTSRRSRPFSTKYGVITAWSRMNRPCEAQEKHLAHFAGIDGCGGAWCASGKASTCAGAPFNVRGRKIPIHTQPRRARKPPLRPVPPLPRSLPRRQPRPADRGCRQRRAPGPRGLRKQRRHRSPPPSPGADRARVTSMPAARRPAARRRGGAAPTRDSAGAVGSDPPACSRTSAS